MDTEKPRQFITIVETTDGKHILGLSKQYTSTFAQRDIFQRAEEAQIPCKNKVFTVEVVVDEDGTCKLVSAIGEELPLTVWKL